VTATLSLDTNRAAKFAEKYAGVTSAKRRDQDFMRDFCDLHGELTALSDTLNRPMDAGKRPKNLPERLAAFPYVNGALFKDTLAQCYFDEAARNTLIDCAKLDWSVITPSIFGSLFQAIMHFDDEGATAKTKKRREFGAHYTSEANISSCKCFNTLNI
jgi:hypothetical protein